MVLSGAVRINVHGLGFIIKEYLKGRVDELSKFEKLNIGSSIWFKSDEEFTVQAKRNNFIVANTKETGEEYTIIDIEKQVCGPDDRVLQFINYKTKDGCQKALDHLINGLEGRHPVKISISKRHRAKVEEVINLEKTLSEI